MNLRRVISVIALLPAIIAVGSVEAIATPVSIFVFGIGRQSCAHWLSGPNEENEGQTWILGFWSGLNDSKLQTVGGNSDSAAIWGEVRKICMNEPSTVMLDATMRVYAQFAATGK